ncbi:hypothetical protein Moror_6660 [Moniliophthora roreri MCA 2997]|uniref:Uncharacterized protein n=1 Tax=Moniliophthora roreri (strain MCA 2997) TaxID=1381753 RepID=V2XC76_MONRO|nr:hypothetical protein Moror_6660 [Moniliophthora roreri MCA 2997]
MATFLAAMQGQVLSLAVGPDGVNSPVVTGLFFYGLLANVFGAILSSQAARWFQMLTEDEAKYAEQVPDGAAPPGLTNVKPDFVNIWITISISSGPYLIGSGLLAFILGLLLYIYETQGITLRVIMITFSMACTLFTIPFALKHDRCWVLNHLHLKRRSD